MSQLSQFLSAIDSTHEVVLREIMGDEYIDTPGFYAAESADYENIFDFMQSTMGEAELERLIDWYERNPKKVKQIIVRIFGDQVN